MAVAGLYINTIMLVSWKPKFSIKKMCIKELKLQTFIILTLNQKLFFPCFDRYKSTTIRKKKKTEIKKPSTQTLVSKYYFPITVTSLIQSNPGILF